MGAPTKKWRLFRLSHHSDVVTFAAIPFNKTALKSIPNGGGTAVRPDYGISCIPYLVSHIFKIVRAM